MQLLICFSFWPPVEGSPNSRAYWIARKKAVDKWKLVARTDIHSQVTRDTPLPLKPPVHASVTVIVPVALWRRRDQDNFMARLKPLWDVCREEGILSDDRQEILKVFPPAFVRSEKALTEGLVVALEGKTVGDDSV